ncbi:Exodeoxyribonuclease 7 large subunit [Neochlamydia sp. TUME1]|uniref:exodeoxyribonuclease VII large subunit n=1 Tax=Neochlamydia sp. TUME1 TaxID=1478174 RepID=UPI00058013D2|nr:exodeoxyribonuclease VII large subunit [Neochlamydia sp. TUME1]KIC75709.1 Exodeoxyribonuclease 7 large subunit [Neochlamydia sp. TUME1]
MHLPASEPVVLSVTQLTQAIKLSLEGTFPNVWLQGEISNCKPHSSGHIYFSLKDAHAQISAIIWRQEAALLQSPPKDGMQVLVRGAINVYPTRGNYQIVIYEMKPVGLGELLIKLEELKQKIHQLGWFRKEHKKPLPRMPNRIGVITSPTGAAIQDILNILTRRSGGLNLLINPVRVQGLEAAQEIAQAIHFFNEHDLVDVIIVGRGGGSIEDLWCFNQEIVAEAIFYSRIPIISAVGHETDHCIADYVADVRAPTPSAAAEIVIADKLEQLKHLEQIKRRLTQSISHKVFLSRQRLSAFLKQPMLSSPYYLLGPWIQRLDDNRQQLDYLIKQKICRLHLILDSSNKRLQTLKPSSQITYLQEKIKYWDKNIYHQMSHIIDSKKEQLESISVALHLINPKNLLTKGYSILFSEKDNSVITSVTNIHKNQDLRIYLSDGEVLSTVKEIKASE